MHHLTKVEQAEIRSRAAAKSKRTKLQVFSAPTIDGECICGAGIVIGVVK